jgi:hypothetical protein
MQMDEKCRLDGIQVAPRLKHTPLHEPGGGELAQEPLLRLKQPFQQALNINGSPRAQARDEVDDEELFVSAHIPGEGFEGFGVDLVGTCDGKPRVAGPSHRLDEWAVPCEGAHASARGVLFPVDDGQRRLHG